MGDVPFPPEPEPEPPTRSEVVAERVNAAATRGFNSAALFIAAGQPIRRPILFIIVGIALILDLPAVGVIALLALALTDQVVAL